MSATTPFDGRALSSVAARAAAGDWAAQSAASAAAERRTEASPPIGLACDSSSSLGSLANRRTRPAAASRCCWEWQHDERLRLAPAAACPAEPRKKDRSPPMAMVGDEAGVRYDAAARLFDALTTTIGTGARCASTWRRGTESCSPPQRDRAEQSEPREQTPWDLDFNFVSIDFHFGLAQKTKEVRRQGERQRCALWMLSAPIPAPPSPSCATTKQLGSGPQLPHGTRTDGLGLATHARTHAHMHVSNGRTGRRRWPSCLAIFSAYGSILH